MNDSVFLAGKKLTVRFGADVLLKQCGLRRLFRYCGNNSLRTLFLYQKLIVRLSTELFMSLVSTLSLGCPQSTSFSTASDVMSLPLSDLTQLITPY